MKTITFFLAFSLMLTLTLGAQTIINVDNSPGAETDYDNLQTAIISATSGDTIYVHASETNYGDITIDKSLTLIGFSHSDTDKESMVNTIILGEFASNLRISGLHIMNDFFAANDNTISNLIVENNLFDGTISNREIIFQNGGADNVIFRGNIINAEFGRNYAGTSLLNSLTNVVIANNIIMQDVTIDYHESTTIENNIFLGDLTIRNRLSITGDLEVEDCIIYVSENSVYDPNNNGVVFNTCLTYNSNNDVINLVGSGNVNNQNPDFVSAIDDDFDPLMDDYHLQAGSPALASGTSGDDIGIYSTNIEFTFNNLGFTAGIPVVTITAITSQIAPGGTLNVSIESNSN